jgi:glutamate 5-kinase
VYDGDPEDPGTQCIATWDDEKYPFEEVVQRGTSALGRGGMHSKLALARKTAKLGTEVVIADGADPDILVKVTGAKGAGTRFPAHGETSSTKRWLASADGHATGHVRVNDGAAAALRDQSRLASLLPVGIEAVAGPFNAGDVIQIRDPAGKVLGCGRARYGFEEADRLKGQRGQKALIHYDYLYLVD